MTKDSGFKIVVGIFLIAFIGITGYFAGLSWRVFWDFPTLLFLIVGTVLLSLLRVKKEMPMHQRRQIVLQSLLWTSLLSIGMGLFGIFTIADSITYLFKGIAVVLLVIPYAAILAGLIHLFYKNKGLEEPQLSFDQITIPEAWGLTPREYDIVCELQKGKSNREIGEALFISETTVKKHITNIFNKAEVTSRHALMMKLLLKE